MSSPHLTPGKRLSFWAMCRRRLQRVRSKINVWTVWCLPRYLCLMKWATGALQKKLAVEVEQEAVRSWKIPASRPVSWSMENFHLLPVGTHQTVRSVKTAPFRAPICRSSSHYHFRTTVLPFPRCGATRHRYSPRPPIYRTDHCCHTSPAFFHLSSS
jgi:hypothetical protein